MREQLEVLKSHPYVGSIRGRGLMVGIELVSNRESKQTFDPSLLIGRRICQAAMDRGVWIRPLGDVVVLMPPLSIDKPELDILAHAVIESIGEVTDSLAG